MVLEKVEQLFKNLFGAERPEGASPGKTRAMAPQVPPEGLQARIRGLLESNARVAAGKLQVISLDRLKEAAPEATQDFEPRLHAAMAETVRRRLGPHDTFSRMDDNVYVIVFENLAKEEAELQCALIVQETLRALFDDRRLDDKVEIRTAAVGIDGAVKIEEVDLLDIISRLVRQPAPHPAPAAQGEAKPARHEMPDFARGLPEDIAFSYRPFWDVKRKVISTYGCVAENGKGKEYAVLGENPPRNLVSALDFLVFGRALHELRRLNAEGKRLLVLCPVHIWTLSDAGTWSIYQALCDRLASVLPHRDMVFKVCGLDEDHGGEDRAVTLARALRRVAPFAHHLVLQTQSRAPAALPLPEDAMPRYLFTELSAFPDNDRQRMKMMDAYVLEAQKQGLGAIVWGLDTLSQVTAAVGSGFTHIGGGAIHAAIERPDFIFRFEARNLLDMLTGGTAA